MFTMQATDELIRYEDTKEAGRRSDTDTDHDIIPLQVTT